MNISFFVSKFSTFIDELLTPTLSVILTENVTVSPFVAVFVLNIALVASITGASESTFDSSLLTGITSVFVSLQFLHLKVLIPVSLLVDSLVTVPLSHSCSFLEIDVISFLESQRVQ